MSVGAFKQVSTRRRRTDEVMRSVLLVGTAIALVPLILIIYYLLHKGLSAWTSSGFFTTDPNGNFFGNPGGIRSAIFGTIEIVALASVIAISIGIGVALYLTEYGRDSRFADVVRYLVDVMTGVPSIVFGLFIYIVLVVAKVGRQRVRGLEGRARAVAVDAADRGPLGRSRAAAGPEQPARGGARARGTAMAGRLPRSCCRPRRRVW